MRSLMLVSLSFLLAAAAFGHAGEIHKYMGMVTAVHDDGSFTLRKTDGGSMRVETSKATIYQRADGGPANRAELDAGSRVVVTIGKDGKTATHVKLASSKS